MGTVRRILPVMVSDRLQAWIRAHFRPDDVDSTLDLLADLLPEQRDSTAAGIERVQAAVLLISAGDSRRFLEAAASAQLDWRDVLVASGLARDDWRDRLNTELGTRPPTQQS